MSRKQTYCLVAAAFLTWFITAFDADFHIFRLMKMNRGETAVTEAVVTSSIDNESLLIRPDLFYGIMGQRWSSIYYYEFTVNGQLIKSNDKCFYCQDFYPTGETNSDGLPIILSHPKTVQVEYLVSDPTVNIMLFKTVASKYRNTGPNILIILAVTAVLVGVGYYLGIGDWLEEKR